MFRSFARTAHRSHNAYRNVKINKKPLCDVDSKKTLCENVEIGKKKLYENIEINKKKLYEKLNNLKNRMKDSTEDDRMSYGMVIGACGGGIIGVIGASYEADDVGNAFRSSVGWGLLGVVSGGITGTFVGYFSPVILAAGIVGLPLGIIGTTIYAIKPKKK